MLSYRERTRPVECELGPPLMPPAPPRRPLGNTLFGVHGTHIRRRVVVIRNNNDRRPFVGDEPFRIAVVAVDVRVRLDAVPETRKRKARESAQERVRRPKGHPLAAVSRAVSRPAQY